MTRFVAFIASALVFGALTFVLAMRRAIDLEDSAVATAVTEARRPPRRRTVAAVGMSESGQADAPAGPR